MNNRPDAPPSSRFLSDRTPVNIRVSTLVALIVFIVSMSVSATLWANNIARSQEDLAHWARVFDHRLERLEMALGVKSSTADRGVDDKSFIP